MSPQDAFDSQWVLGAWWGTIDAVNFLNRGDGRLGCMGLAAHGSETWLDWGICDNMRWQARGRNGRK